MRQRGIFQPRIVLAAGLCLAAGSGYAQTNQGQIAGAVLDASGASIPNAQVTAKNEATGSTYNTTSTSSGSYRFPSIELGKYTLSFTAPGFSKQVNTGVEVRVQTVTSFDAHLSTGATTETVTVDANAPTVESQSSDVGGTVTDHQVVDLPLALGGVGAMRSPESFVFLIPGTAGPGTGNSANGIFISKIGGGQNFGNEVLLDGADQTRSENGSSFDEESPSVEAIAEFKVTTSTPAAEFGHTSGGIENFVTKSGTNHIHGSAFGLFQNEALNANNWFNNGKQSFYNSIGDTADANRFKRQLDRQFDYGINAGAPLVIPHVYNGRDKTFGFFSWEQYRRNGGGTATSTVPTVAERNGDFSALLNNGPNGQINPCDGSQILNGQIFDPATTQTVNGIRCRTAFAGNIIPSNRFSKVGQNIAAFYPAPTNSALAGNYVLASSSTLFNTTYTIRVDENAGKNDKIFASYSTRENQRYNPQNVTFPGPIDPTVQTQDFLTHFVRIGWDHVFSPTVLNHLVLGYNRSNSINGSVWSQGSTNYNTQLGTPFTIGFPQVDVGGYTRLSKNQDDDNIDNGLRLADNVSWQKGRHSFKFGVDFRYQEYSTFAHDTQNGELSFQTGETRATQTGNFNSGTGNGFASLLLGAGDGANSTLPFHIAKWLSTYTAGFAQDDFKVSNSLVLNLGVRYDVDVPRREAHNNTSNFDPAAIDPKNGLPGALVFGTTCTNCNTRWANIYYKDIAPRVGFAFSPVSLNNKFVLRGGFSTLYAPLLYNDFGNNETTGYITPTVQNGNGFDPAFALDGGVKPSVAGTDLDPGFWDNGNANAPLSFSNYIKPSYGRPGQINQWNLQVQQELAKDLILTVGYIGSAGSHLKSGIENLNNMPRSNFSRGDALVNYNLGANGVATPYAAFNGNVQQALRPFPQYGFIATDCCLQNVGHSSYEALIASLERRMRNGLSLTASYTWSKTLTNADSALPGTNAGVAQIQDPFNSKSQKSLSIQDIPNTFVTSFLYELPFGKNKALLNFDNPIARSLISGFEVGGVLRYQSGQPESFGGANGIPGWDNFIEFTRIPTGSLASNARRGHIDPLRQFRLQNSNGTSGLASSFVPNPNVDSEFNGLQQSISAQSGQSENPAYSALQTNPAFYDQNNANNRRLRAVQAGTCPTCDNGGFLFGNVPRVTGEVRNYLYNNEDFSVLKKTPITESTLLILKVELLNAFNRHIFGTPDLQPYDGGFGVPGYTIDDPTSTGNFGRVLQLTGRIQF